MVLLPQSLLGRVCAAAVVALAVATCADERGPAPTQFALTAAAANELVFTSQPTSTGAGAAIAPAVQVTARDAAGNTDVGFTGAVSVALGTNPSGGTLSGTTTVAAVNGVARFSNLSIDRAGSGYTLAASASGLTGATSSAFDITSGAAAQLVFTVQPSTTAAGAAITPAVQVTASDALGNRATSFTGDVTLAITAGTGTSGAALSGTTTVAATSGVATFSSLSIDKSGAGYRLSATTAGLAAATSSPFDITGGTTPAVVSASQSTVAAAPSSITAGSGSATITVTVKDASGNPISGATVVLSATGSGNTLTQPTGQTNANGVATGTLSSTVAETKRIAATVNGIAITQTATVTVTPATALVFTVQPSNTTAGATITPAVQVTARDPSGNTITNFTGSVSVALATNPTGGTLSGTTTVAAVAGVATFSSLSINKAGSGYQLAATATGLTRAVSVRFAITASAATRLAFTVQPSDATAGATIRPAVQVTALDALGNTATAFSGNVTVAIGTNPAGGALSGATTVAAVAGFATFSNLSIDKAGSGYTLTATAAGLAGATSRAFNITAGTTPAAITHALLTAGNNTVNQRVYSTAAIAPAPNTLITVAVMGHRAYGATPSPTLSGGGMTAWTEVATVTLDSVAGPLKRLTIYRAMSAAPGSGPLTITFSGNVAHCQWIVSQWDGVEASGVNGAGAVVQTGSSRGDTVSGLTVPLTAFGNPRNVAYGVFGAKSRVAAVTPGAGFTEISEQPSAEWVASDLEAEWATNLNTVAATWTRLNGGALGVELRSRTTGP